MVSLSSLWLPILVSAVFVFIASSIIHMVLRYHQSDIGPVPDEDDVMSALRQANITPGDYVMPHASGPGAMRTEAYQEKVKKGPVVFMTVLSGGFSTGPRLIQWFVYCLIVGVFAAYIGGSALGEGAGYLEVFRFVGCTAFIGYSLALLQNSIWWSKSWMATLKSIFDGLIYALLTAGTFGWLWP